MSNKNIPKKQYDALFEKAFKQGFIAGKVEGFEVGKCVVGEWVEKELRGWFIEIPELENPIENSIEDLNKGALFIGRTNYNKTIRDLIDYLTLPTNISDEKQPTGNSPEMAKSGELNKVVPTDGEQEPKQEVGK